MVLSVVAVPDWCSLEGLVGTQPCEEAGRGETAVQVMCPFVS